MNSQEVLQQKNRILTNYFNGKNMNTNVQNELRREMQFNIDATLCTMQRKVALIPAFFETFLSVANPYGSSIFSNNPYGIIYKGQSYGNFQPVIRSNPYFLNKAGFGVDIVLDESNNYFLDGTNDYIKMYSGTPSATITDFLQFIKTNPVFVKKLMVISQQVQLFIGSLEIAEVDPRSRAQVDSLSLARFMSPDQFKSDRIEMDFSATPLQLSDTTLLTATIPAATMATFIFTFFSEQESAQIRANM